MSHCKLWKNIFCVFLCEFEFLNTISHLFCKWGVFSRISFFFFPHHTPPSCILTNKYVKLTRVCGETCSIRPEEQSVSLSSQCALCLSSLVHFTEKTSTARSHVASDISPSTSLTGTSSGGTLVSVSKPLHSCKLGSLIRTSLIIGGCTEGEITLHLQALL